MSSGGLKVVDETVAISAGYPGTLVAWGDNSYGQTNVPAAAQSGVTAIAVGSSHTAALKSSGAVVAWGNNNYGQTNVPVAAQSGVTAIAVGSSHTVALKEINGTVVVWGDNSYGQTNVPVAAQTGVTTIAAGSYHTVALKSNGTVVAWGAGNSNTGVFPNYGQSLVPVAAQSGVWAIAVGDFYTVALTTNGTVVVWGDNSYGQTNVPVGLSRVLAIAAGSHHIIALKKGGTVVAWGENNYGQTNVPVAAQSGVTAIAVGSSHSVALNESSGTVLVWGNNEFGQTNVPVAAQSGVTAIAVGSSHTVALKNDGTVVAWGNNEFGQTSVPAAAQTGVTAIAAGNHHTAALIGKAAATVALGSLSQTHDGTAKSATATTSPHGLTVNFTYNGSPTAPISAGSYTVIGTVSNPNYQGSATGTLIISKATATVTLGSLNQTYNGTARSATATTSPTGLAVDFTYNGSPNAPTNAGSYIVIGTINDLNYQGSATNTLVVILPTITTQPLSQTVNAGDTATFSVGVAGTGAQFQWRFNGTDLVGKTSSTLILNSIGTNQAGIYLVLVTVGPVSLLSAPAELVVPLPGQPGSKKWQFTYGGAIDTTPALAKDGTVYVAADSALIALNPSGSQKWTLSLPGLLYASPTVAADGTIYVGAWWFTTLYAVNPNGTLRWQTNLPGWSSPYSQSIADDGTIIVSLGGELTSTRMYALDTNGTPKWSFDAGGRPSGAAVAYDGTIYIGNSDTNQFFALNPDGSAKWGLMGIYNPTMPAIGADGTIYIGGFFDLQFRAFRPDGTMLWQYPTSASVVGTTAVVGTDGTIYIATIWDGKLYALNPDGTLKWVHDLGDRTYIGLAVSKQGTIYTSANEKRFLAINPDGTTQWEFVTGSQEINPNEGRRSSPTIAPDGTIYFPVNQPGIGGVIFAIQGDSGPAESSWPMAYQNAQHTSRVPFAITNQPASQIVLSGSNVVFSIGVASTQPCIFQWRHNGGDLPNQTNDTLILPNVALDAQGVYACLVSNRSGAYVSHNASLTVTTTFTLWITKQGVNVQLSWPVAYSNYTLLGSVSLTGGAWITNSSSRTISGSNIFVTLPATNSRMFYRVVMP